MASASEFVAKCQCCIIVKGLLTVASEHSKDKAHEPEVLEKKIHEIEEGRKLGAQLRQRLIGITLKYQRTNNS